MPHLLQSSMRFGTRVQENSMARLDLDTLACVDPECQLFRRARGGSLVMRISGDILRATASCRAARRREDSHRRSPGRGARGAPTAAPRASPVGLTRRSPGRQPLSAPATRSPRPARSLHFTLQNTWPTRPHTLACVDPECQLFRRARGGSLVMRIRGDILRCYCFVPRSQVA